MDEPDALLKVRSIPPPVLYLLGAVEFSAAAWLTLASGSDTKNAFIFGYSLSRLALFGVACLAVIAYLYCLARPQAGVKLSAFVRRAGSSGLGVAVVLLALLGMAAALLPSEVLGWAGAYLDRMRPLLFIAMIQPAQLALVMKKNCLKKIDPVLARLGVLVLAGLLAFCGFIYFTGLGVTPEKAHWDVAGTPLTSLQLVLSLLTAGLLLGFLSAVKARLPRSGWKIVDLSIVLLLFAGALLLWMGTPQRATDFSTRPAAPYYQSYPHSDAAVHDLGALTILAGQGILFRNYTDKPLYMVFLAWLHILGGNNYALLGLLHAGFMALMAPALYLLGKGFHSRFFGLLLAGIVILRQTNAIELTKFFNYGATPRQFLTEVPTLLGLILFTWVLFAWAKSIERGRWYAFLEGGLLGAVTLVRLNPFLLIPAVPVFILFAARGRIKPWLVQSALFLLGCALLIAPWTMVGQDAYNRPYFLLKFIDIINVRYDRGGATLPAGATLSSGPALPQLDIHKFPGFVINHSLHNFVGSFLTLPDSWQVGDQSLGQLMQRPYWKEGREVLQTVQLPFLLANLALMALGLAWSWRRWKWAGLAPVFVFAVYSLSLGLGRTSGSRYLVPIDWLVDFYFCLGIVSVLQALPAGLLGLLSAQAEPGGSQPVKGGDMPVWARRVLPAGVILAGLLIPAAQMLVHPRLDYCQPVASDVFSQASALPGDVLLRGEVLYPVLTGDVFRFTLLTCKDAPELEAAGFAGSLPGGTPVIAGLSPQSGALKLAVLGLPGEAGAPAQVLWRAWGR